MTHGHGYWYRHPHRNGYGDTEILKKGFLINQDPTMTGTMILSQRSGAGEEERSGSGAFSEGVLVGSIFAKKK